MEFHNILESSNEPKISNVSGDNILATELYQLEAVSLPTQWNPT